MTRISTLTPMILALALAASLAGCGGALGPKDVSLPPGDSATFLPLVQYCGATVPGPQDAQLDGFTQAFATHYDAGYNGVVVTSAGGASNAELGPINLGVGLGDYRGVQGDVNGGLPSTGVSQMGAQVSAVFGAKSVACVAPVSRAVPAHTSILFPDVPKDPWPQLVWRSYWDQALPLRQLTGFPVDGFELVSNYGSSANQAYFVLDKKYFAGTQDLSVCYLAPGAVQWDCKPWKLSDQGSAWTLSMEGANKGVYLLVSSVVHH